MVTNLKDLLILHEGVVPHAYQDSLGYWTIGVGHLVDQRKGGRLPDEVIWDLLDRDIKDKQARLFSALPWAKELDEVRKAVLTDMAFNLGIYGLLGFKNTLAAVKEERWQDAARGMLASKWATQVGMRALRLADMMRTGRWPDVFVGPY
jgi:lysozyme